MEPRRHLGGISALAGFDFQLRMYLYDYICTLIDGSKIQAASEKFTYGLEALSDYTRSNHEQLICVQVKRTLDSGALSAAAAEFAKIDAFLDNEGENELRNFSIF